MKILKIILPLLLWHGSSADAQISIALHNGCNAYGHATSFGTYPETFAPSAEATDLVNAIIAVAGAPANFKLRFAQVDQVISTTDQGTRYLLYSNAFLKRFDQKSTYWGAYFTLAHEIGHHLKKHDLDESDPFRVKYNELDADVFAGAALLMLGTTLREAQEAVASLSLLEKTDTRPGKSSRLKAMTLGWKRQHAKLYGDQSFEADKEIVYHMGSEDWSRDDTQKAAKNKAISKTMKQAKIYGYKPSATSQYPLDENSGSDGNEIRLAMRGTSELPPTYSATSKYASMPNLPWPPPDCYQRKTLVENLSAKAARFADIDERLRRALDALGYYQRCYYQTPGGFAIATQMEQFESDGNIKKRFRWTDYPVHDDFEDVYSYFKSLIMPTPGRFRVFVFVVTDVPFKVSAQEATPGLAIRLSKGGDNIMATMYAQKEVTSAHYLEVLIYEFEAPQSTKKCSEKCPASLDVEQHLTKSGLSKIPGF